MPRGKKRGDGDEEAQVALPEWIKRFELGSDDGRLLVVENAVRGLVEGVLPGGMFDRIMEGIKVATAIDANRHRKQPKVGAGQGQPPTGVTPNGPFRPFGNMDA